MWQFMLGLNKHYHHLKLGIHPIGKLQLIDQLPLDGETINLEDLHMVS
jgi:hypothetical protein